MPKAAKPAPKNGNAGSAPHPRAPVREDRDALLRFVRREGDRRVREAHLELLADMERKHYEEILAVAKKMEESGKFPPVSS